jgi:hypothetical protein
MQARSLVKTAFVMAAFAGSSEAGRLTKVWEFNAGGGLGVFGLSFSPDGKRVAAVVGRSWQDESILILNAADPQTNRRTLSANPKYWENAYSGGGFSWSPPGEFLAVGGTMVEISTGNACQLRGAGGFVDDSHITVQGLPSHISALDTSCRDLGGRGIAPWMYLLDTSPDRGLLYIGKSMFGGPPFDSFVEAADSGKIVRKLAFSRLGKFADSGRALCVLRGKAWHEAVECIDVESGSRLGSTKDWGFPNLRTAAHAPRVVVTEYWRKLDFVDWRWALGSLRKRVVWDYRLGKELMSWRPRFQDVISGFAPLNAVPRPEPYCFAISPDGEYIIEGGAGILTLYKIEP